MLSPMSFPSSVSKTDRIAAVAPMLNAAIQQMDEGDLHKSMGVEKFDDELFKVIDTAGLMDKNRCVKWRRLLYTQTTERRT